jgi:hypothetical protein
MSVPFKRGQQPRLCKKCKNLLHLHGLKWRKKGLGGILKGIKNQRKEKGKCLNLIEEHF